MTADSNNMNELIQNSKSTFTKIFDELSKAVIGQEETLEHIIITLIGGGHGLLIGVPGLGKTMIVKTIAKIFDLNFKRIQFTPDLMPADIIGTDILEEDKMTGKREIKFVKGPVFTNILLADEINRTPPKTQAALLEAMGENQVTASGNTFILEPPFFTLASQNPIEQEGTYPLPEAQLDRFLMSIQLDYLPLEHEIKMVQMTTSNTPMEVNTVITAEEIIAIQALVKEIPVPDNILEYAVSLAYSTRPNTKHSSETANKYVRYGAGSRASQALITASKAKALMDGRVNASIEDVKAIAKPVLRHRIALNFKANADGIQLDDLLNEWINKN
ncbi:MAG: AAA family ATPase [Planctomycetota bacterium]|nr:MAG: AAA family ATPase [Planctomycetota bacterium]